MTVCSFTSGGPDGLPFEHGAEAGEGAIALEFGSPGRQVEGRAGVGSGAKMHISGSES